MDLQSKWKVEVDSPYFTLSLKSPQKLQYSVEIEDVDDLSVHGQTSLQHRKYQFEDFEFGSCWYVEEVSGKTVIHVIFPYAGRFAVHIKAKAESEMEDSQVPIDVFSPLLICSLFAVWPRIITTKSPMPSSAS